MHTALIAQLFGFVGPVSEKFPKKGFVALCVKPAGSTSVMTTPVASAPPTLRTLIVYVTKLPPVTEIGETVSIARNVVLSRLGVWMRKFVRSLYRTIGNARAYVKKGKEDD